MKQLSAETQVWLKSALKYQYLSIEEEKNLSGTYNQVLSGLVKMINQPAILVDWLKNAKE
ncbi:MAG: hypothetical protein PUP92_13065 [Rhizonema sp. PD38]|nr:hypothetical protein [Rhizonema sp. PD38]